MGPVGVARATRWTIRHCIASSRRCTSPLLTGRIATTVNDQQGWPHILRRDRTSHCSLGLKSSSKTRNSLFSVYFLFIFCLFSVCFLYLFYLFYSIDSTALFNILLFAYFTFYYYRLYDVIYLFILLSKYIMLPAA